MTDKKIPFSDELIRQVAQQYGTPFHIYDEKGIHSVSVKALFKTDEIQKPTKTDIKRVVSAYYGYEMSDLTDDQSDSMALIYTLLNKKWNADITAKIKEEKKEIKSLKMQKAIDDQVAEGKKLTAVVVRFTQCTTVLDGKKYKVLT